MQSVLDLDLIRTFSAVVEEGGFKAAADRLGRTPSSVSMQIKRLEDQLQRRLLERNNQGIVLTEAGRTLTRYSEQFLRLNAVTLSALLREELSGEMHFGIPADYAPKFLSRFLPVLRRHFPNLRPRITSEPSRVLRRLIRAKEIDIAFVSQDPGTQEGELLWSEGLAWWASRDFAPPEDDKLPVAVLSTDCVLRDLAFSCLTASDVGYDVVFSSSSLTAVMAAVEAGLAAALLPDSSLAGAMGLSSIEDTGLLCQETLRVCMVWSSTTKKDKAEKILSVVRPLVRS